MVEYEHMLIRRTVGMIFKLLEEKSITINGDRETLHTAFNNAKQKPEFKKYLSDLYFNQHTVYPTSNKLDELISGFQISGIMQYQTPYFDKININVSWTKDDEKAYPPKDIKNIKSIADFIWEEIK